MLGGDRLGCVAARQDHQPLDVVAKLADVARPVVGLKHGHGVVADGARRQAGGARNLLDEMAHEQRDVLAPLGQRRNAQRHDGQAVEQVLAERALGDLALKVAAGGGNDAHVDGDAVGAADALEGLVDEDAQDLVLRLARHVADFVEVERAAVGLLQRADLAAGAVDGLGAEQLVLHALGRDRRGVEHDERPGSAQRQLVDRARDQFLARARRAGNHDAAVGRRDLLDHGAQVVHRRRGAEKLARLARPLA